MLVADVVDLEGPLLDVLVSSDGGKGTEGRQGYERCTRVSAL
jgi:hypothetical protein